MPDQYGTFGSYLADTLEGNRAFAKQYADEQALKAYAANPDDTAAQTGLIARNPTAFSQIVNARTGAMKAQAEADTARSAAYQDAMARWAQGGQRGPRPVDPSAVPALPPLVSPYAAPAQAGGAQPNQASPTSIVASTVARPGAQLGGAPAGGAPPPAAPADAITVTAPQPKLSDAEVGGVLDPKHYEAYLNGRRLLAGLDESERKRLTDKAETFAAIGAQFTPNMSIADRQAIVDAHRGDLRAHGFTDQEIDNADLSDASVATQMNLARGIKGMDAKSNADRTFAETQRSHIASEADRDASRAISIRGQNMADARSREANMITAGGVGKQVQKVEGDLRKEFDALPEVKSFKTIRSQGQQIKSLAKNPTPQNDIAMVFTYMKMLDPGSVVREGEFATAQNAAGVPERVRNAYNKAQTGQLLNPSQRIEMVRSANQIYTAQRQVYNDKARQYKGYATDYGVDGGRVATTYGSKPRAVAPAVPDDVQAILKKYGH